MTYFLLEAMLILIVEDEIELAGLIMEYLEDEGFECDHAARVSQARNFIEEHHYDVIVLDVNLPDGLGFELCREYRDKGVNTPTIMLTARGTLEDKSQGFDSGVDDYLVKPFAMEELVMRLHALSQRGKRSHQLDVGPIQLKVSNREAMINHQPLSLSPDEWRLFLFLVSRENEVLPKHKIMSHMWPDDTGTDDALKMLLFRLRKQIRTALVKQELDDDLVQIESVRGVGLRLLVK